MLKYKVGSLADITQRLEDNTKTFGC